MKPRTIYTGDCVSVIAKFTCQNEACGAKITAWPGAKGQCPFCWEPYFVLPLEGDDDADVIIWDGGGEA